MDKSIKKGAYNTEQQIAKVDWEAQLRELTQQIDKLMKEKSCVVVGIDGSCTSGKSTLAGWLAEQYDCNVFHMDDFFLRPEQRTEARLAEPGGNVDRERFAEEVLLPVMKWKKDDERCADPGKESADRLGKESADRHETESADSFGKESAYKSEPEFSFEYRPYDCSVQRLGKAVGVKRKKLNIIEGSYSLHPELEYAYDLKVLLAVHPEIRKERILQRPAFLHQRFFEEWIPMEQKYFNSSNITQRCDMILVNIDL